MKNPPWTRDELILALELYFREPSARGSQTHTAVKELSDLLNALPIHSARTPRTTFRNPNGVAMKLSNFLQYDPSYSGKGLVRGSHLEKMVWAEFAHDPQMLQTVANAIRANYEHASNNSKETLISQEDDDEAVEGQLLTRIHKVRERNARIVRKKKDQVLHATGCLACEACGFDFQTVYGSLGKDFAECHHEKPLSTLVPGESTKLSDLRIVCANCHRMIHRSRPWLTVHQLAARISKSESTQSPLSKR